MESVSNASARAPRTFRKRWLHEQTRWGYLCLLPTLIFLGVFVVFPVLFALYLSFTSWDMVSPVKPWVGLDNYRNLFQDHDFILALENTAYFSAGLIVLTVVCSLSLALLLNRTWRGVAFFRALYYTPSIVSIVAISAIWLWLYEPTYGLLNAVLGIFGASPVQWLGDPNWAMPSVIIMTVWKNAGYYMVIYLAGLNGIPKILYEAASIDGATGLQRFRHITWPLLMPVTMFVVVLSIINSFQVFGQIYVMTSGGPVKSTLVIAYYLYLQAFSFFHMGYASAIAYVLFAVIFVLTLIQMKLLGPRTTY